MTVARDPQYQPRGRRTNVLFRYPELPKLELRLYMMIVATTTIYAWTNVLLASQKFEFKLGQMASISRLPIFGERFKDESNWEWTQWSAFGLNLLPYLVVHSVIFNLINLFYTETVCQYIVIVYSLAFCCKLFGLWLLTISLCQGLLVFAVAQYTRQQMGVWLGSLPILYYVMNHTMMVSNDPFLVLLFVSYTLLSTISYNLDRMVGEHRPEDKTVAQQYGRMLYYTYYLPYMVAMVVNYSDFEKQMLEARHRSRNYPQILYFGARVIFWWFFIELMLHFLYFEAMLLDPVFSARLPKDQFVTLGMAMGVFFHLKYVVIFGVPSVFAQLDRMQPFDPPICISRVTLYSKIWRSFDRGLYSFFKKYIFLPICAPTFTVPRKLLGVLVSYGFVLLWHGFMHQTVVWIILNILGLLVEYTGKGLYTLDAVRRWRELNLSNLTFRRILAWLQIIPFVFGIYSNFYFLGGSTVGYMFVRRIWEEETLTLRYPFFLLITLGYFFAQLCIEVDRRQSLKTEKIA